MTGCAVAIVDDVEMSATGRLAACLDRADFWSILEQVTNRRRSASRIVIKPESSGFCIGSPTVTDPALVEALVDLLHDRGFTGVTIVGTADSSALWAENRDLFALSDLLGYRFATAKSRPYELVDLAEGPMTRPFPIDTVLHGTGISRLWCDADMRIVFSKNRTDEATGYALCLDTLIGVLPLADKDLFYRKRRHPGDVVASLLSVAPVHFCLIDAEISAHGAAGRRAPLAHTTRTMIASSDIVLADYAGAMKMGLDADISPIYARLLPTHPLPSRYTVVGSLNRYPGWENVTSLSLRTTQMRNRSETLGRLVEPWLQRLDPLVFPLKNPLDTKLNSLLAEFFADTEADSSRSLLLMLASMLLTSIGRAEQSYQTLFDKDSLPQSSVPLAIDLSRVNEDAFDKLVDELQELESVAAEAPSATDALAWRQIGEAVVFRYMRTLPIDYSNFIKCVDIARTIGYMNDYLGGVVVPLRHDAEGRVVRQAERNIYLPQPTSCCTAECPLTSASWKWSSTVKTAIDCIGRRCSAKMAPPAMTTASPRSSADPMERRSPLSDGSSSPCRHSCRCSILPLCHP
jgi:uncharacterized protein (DUF362 family)